MRTLEPPTLADETETLLRRLRLPHIRRAAPEVLATARSQRWEPAEVLKALLSEELTGRERSALATRRKAAAFPTGKTFDAWEPGSSSIPAPTQVSLRTLEWVRRRENLVICGPSGTGKSLFLEALGQTAVEVGMKVAWFTLEDLGVLMRRHRADDTLTKAVARILRSELVLPAGLDGDRMAGLSEDHSASSHGDAHPRPGSSIGPTGTTR
jgi:DNA replication protein DnaC